MEKSEIIDLCQGFYRQLQWVDTDEENLRRLASAIYDWIDSNRVSWTDLGFTHQDVRTRLEDTLFRKSRNEEMKNA